MEPYSDIPRHYPSFGERITDAWDRGMRVARRIAIAFGLSTALAIGVGAAVTDNAFAQIVVTVLAAIGFWIPMLFATVGVERMIERRRQRKARVLRPATTASPVSPPHGGSWTRLAAAAPKQRDRLLAVQRSLDASHSNFRAAALDPDAHDLCVLINRRLPELIDHELDSLPPDDRGRRKQIGELVDLVEQFARHCSRKRDGEKPIASYQAEILRRRFEDRLTGAGSLDRDV